jgi:hypothetical protein
MRILFLSLLFILQVNASEVILSAILGKLLVDKKPNLGDKLKINKKYIVSKNSKIQILINKNASVTISQNSLFIITYLDEFTCRIDIQSGTYKIFNLSSESKSLKLELHIDKNLVIIKNNIALIKLSSKNLALASAKNTTTFIYKGEKIDILDDEMINVKNRAVKKSKIMYNIFQDIFIKKDSSKIDIKKFQDSQIDNPADLDN